MEIRAFAERVLFATTLEEKLAPPDSRLSDTSPGPPVNALDAPGRPDNLQFSKSGERSPIPKGNLLESEEDRGRLLHFFANHELLAAELMALVLLRFPQAPPAFREGVARTLQEEQMHTRLYLRRLQQCGWTFGQQPVNGFFWNAVSSMKTPADYVARLSLTFEQANLDYSRHFAKVFAQSGDLQSAKILDRIYRDEINHVGYGLEWFRRWKEPRESDWEAFRQRLVFPLSPSRAKGKGIFNREGRLEAGLPSEFIDQLEIFTQSKGRTPNVYHFNPETEWCIAREQQGLPLQKPAGTLLTLSEDLSALTLYLARQDDVALLARHPSLSFLQKLRRVGMEIPEIQERSAIQLSERKLGELRPWGWSLDSARLFADLADQATSASSTAWEPAWAELHSKVFSTRLAQSLGDARGQVCESWEGVRRAMETLGPACVLKAPFGLAGKGLRFEDSKAPSPSLRQWIAGILKEQSAIVVEPQHERVFDFSVQYGKHMRLLGYTALHNDKRGRFLGCSVEKTLTASAGEEATRLFYGRDRAIQHFYEETLPATLSPLLTRLRFDGPLGVDAMLARDAEGRLVHHPIIEINPRTTMGRVTLELARYVVKGERALFQILTKAHLKKHGHADFPSLAAALESRPPESVRYQNGHRRLRSGTVVLNDPSHAKAFLAILRVGQDADLLLW